MKFEITISFEQKEAKDFDYRIKSEFDDESARFTAQLLDMIDRNISGLKKSSGESKWIEFEPEPQFASKKTLVWKVVTKEDHFVLGVIKWFGRWRGYAFFPTSDTVFEKQCLRDIAAFLEIQNKEHREKKLAG